MTAVELVKLWLAIRPIRRLKERRARKRGEAGSQTEVPMNTTVVTQLVLMLLRHGMTALGPLGVTVSDDALMQLAAVVVTLLGLTWSAIRKLKAAKQAVE